MKIYRHIFVLEDSEGIRHSFSLTAGYRDKRKAFEKVKVLYGFRNVPPFGAPKIGEFEYKLENVVNCLKIHG